MARDDRTVFDLDDDEYEDYQEHPENWEDVTENSYEDAYDMMYPDEDSRDDDQLQDYSITDYKNMNQNGKDRKN